jgi:prepilin signal peptidase PulO-like enzyme (type II secretory pathway)
VIGPPGRPAYQNDSLRGRDVKRAVFIGAAVGLRHAPTALVAGILVDGVLGLLVLLAGRSSRATMPDGPALAVGAYLTLLLAGPWTPCPLVQSWVRDRWYW